MTEHYDRLGQELAVDDYVAFPQANRLMIGKITKLSNKMIIIDSVVKKRVNRRTGEYIETYRKYPADSIRVQTGAGLTMYVIRHS